MSESVGQVADAEGEVATLVADLIRIDTTNYGDESGPGEIEAADYCAMRLREVGIDAIRFSTSSDRRAGVIARIEGSDRTRPALLVHGHLDVVPAPEDDWVYPPLSGVIDEDGMLWGRGAVDMKDMVGMTLAVVRSWARRGIRPRRDIVVLFVPDEEAGCVQGSHWLVQHRPELLAGVGEAIGEVGGFSVALDPSCRIYPIQTAEKGIAWLSLTATGQSGHGSLVAVDNAIAGLAGAVTRILEHRWPPRLTPAVRQLIEVIEEVSGRPLNLDDPEDLRARFGPLGRVLESTSRNTANATMLHAGYKHNVIPGSASACIDARFVPGDEGEILAELGRLAGGGVRHHLVHHDVAVETEFAGPTVDAMCEALRAHDAEATPVPFLMPGGTDAKALSRLGIRCFGFSPLRLPDDLDFFGMFHSVNERVPVAGLRFGVRVLDEFLRRA